MIESATPTDPPGERRSRSVPIRKLIPNMMTAGALCSGLAALQFATNGEFGRAVAAIGLAALLDALDGRAARLLRVTTRFGETLDSISDFVCFGIAPFVILYNWLKGHWSVGGVGLEGVGLLVLVTYTLCTAYRLARFTAMQRRKRLGAKPSPFFQGLPSPAAGGAALIPPMLELSDAAIRLPTLVVLGWTLALGLLMVSRLPYYSGKGGRIRRSAVLPLMLVVGLIVVGAARDAWLTFSLLCAAYVASVGPSIPVARRVAAAQAAGQGPTQGPPPP